MHKFIGNVLLVVAVIVALGSVRVSAQTADNSALIPVFTAETIGLVAVAIFLAAVAEFIVAGLVTPFFDKYGWDKFWLMYVGWAVASVIVAFSKINLFASYIPDPLIGQVLTAVFCGGGSNKIHDFFDMFLSKKKIAASGAKQ